MLTKYSMRILKNDIFVGNNTFTFFNDFSVNKESAFGVLVYIIFHRNPFISSSASRNPRLLKIAR